MDLNVRLVHAALSLVLVDGIPTDLTGCVTRVLNAHSLRSRSSGADPHSVTEVLQGLVLSLRLANDLELWVLRV